MELLTPEQLALLSEKERAIYKHQLEYTVAQNSPLDMAEWISPQTERAPHLEYINDRVRALLHYRLYHKAGPGPEAHWYYRTERDGPAIPALDVYHLPEDIYEAWGQHPNDPDDRVVYKLGIAVPPRHGKSWIVTEHLPLWVWSIDPDADIGFATYSDDFAQKWGVRLRQRINENAVRLNLKLANGERHDAQHLYFSNTAGQMYLVGTGGSMTGRGWQVGLIDDPIKDGAEATSAATRNAKADWYESTFDTRATKTKRFPFPVQIMTFTRWNEDDPAGRFIYDENKQVRPDWHMVRLPALAEEDDPLGRQPGEALWPKVMTAKELENRRERDPLWFGALFQGWPTMGDLGLFGSWQDYVSTPEQYSYRTEDGSTHQVSKTDCVRYAMLDTAYTKNTWSDYSVFTVLDWCPDKQVGFIVHVEREKMNSTRLRAWLEALWDNWKPTVVGIEDVTSGKELLQELRFHGTRVVYRPIPPIKDKVTRAIGYAQAVRLGRYRVPRSGSWVHDWREEHSLFPDNGKHDDQVDTGSYLHWMLQRAPSTKQEPNSRFIKDTTPEGRVARHMEKLDRQAKKKNRASRNRVLSGRLGR